MNRVGAGLRRDRQDAVSDQVALPGRRRTGEEIVGDPIQIHDLAEVE